MPTILCCHCPLQEDHCKICQDGHLLAKDNDSIELWTFVKLVLILSYGNASVESGFSVNSFILVENMHEDSIVAQRTVYDAMQAAGGVLKVDINKTVQQFVRTSRSRYQDALQRQREQLSYEDKRRQDKKRAADQN